jgi:RNA 2',3'-cyclic 3'-phosphodiesterase
VTGATLRLFVAVELPDQTKRELSRAADALRAAGARDLRWVRPEGIHVTLKFLGATDERQVAEIERAVAEAARGVRAFDLKPEGIGSFGGRRHLRVAWAGLGGDRQALAALAARVEEAIAPLGFPTEQRAFNPHLTLARVRDETPPDERQRLHEAIASVRAPTFTPFRVERVSLMRSTLGRGGAVYDALSTHPLG